MFSCMLGPEATVTYARHVPELPTIIRFDSIVETPLYAAIPELARGALFVRAHVNKYVLPLVAVIVYRPPESTVEVVAVIAVPSLDKTADPIVDHPTVLVVAAASSTPNTPIASRSSPTSPSTAVRPLSTPTPGR